MNMITIPVIALRSMTVLPDMVIHFDISRKISIKAVEAAMENDEKVLLLTQTDSAVKSPTAKDLYMTGTIASVKRVIRMPNKLVRVQVEGLKKAVAADINTEGDYIYADVQECSTFIEETDKVSDKAIVIGMNELLRQYAAANPRCNKEMLNHWLAIDNARELMSSVICDFPMEYTDRQKFLEMNNILDMYEYIAGILIELTQAYSIKEEISGKVRAKVDENQREYILKEQLEILNKELGQDEYSETNELEEKIDKLNASDEVKDKLHKEVKRLKNLSKGSSEVNVERTYIENCLELPWNNMSEDNNDIINARKVLDNDHYGMKDIKDRIIEALAVRNITSNTDAPILCLAGPPGTGKTSIARSVAAALNKEYVRICLGGVKDEAEIRGHRKTYVGAMPGRIIEGLKKAGTANPLMLLDEIDKVSNDYKSDTASALLEVLDSEQNSHFTDHYIEMPVDLSKVLFIATANDLSTLSRPLLDRMEIIEVSGYSVNEKLHIAYGIFMIGFYILGGIEGNSVLMEIQAFLFVMFVLCQFVYNQVSRLYEVFVFNEGKSEFPARRIMGINVLIMIVFGLLLVFGMLIFYHGRYGNIFSMIGMALLAIIKWILKLLLMLRGDDDTVMDDYIEETTTSPEPVEDEMDVMVNNAAGNALMEVVAIFLIIGVIILIIVTIVRYASRFRKSLDNDKDEVEYINNDEEKEYKVKKSVKVKDTKDKANIRYRKLYKKYAKSKKVVTKSKLAGAKVDSHMMPEEITSKLITDDEAKARRITDDYEKARYSNGEVSEEDISFLKNFK